MKIIKSIDLKSAGKVYAVFIAVIAFLTSIGIAISNIYYIFITGDYTAASIFATIIFNLIIGILTGLISALLGAIIGYAAGVAIAWIYNKTVKMTGGVKIKVE